MNSIQLTKIVCSQIDSKFICLYLRSRKIEKGHLLLYPTRDSYRILDPEIKSLILSSYNDYKKSQLSLEDYWGLNIVYAIDRGNRGRATKAKFEFNLQRTTFDQSREVRL